MVAPLIRPMARCWLHRTAPDLADGARRRLRSGAIPARPSAAGRRASHCTTRSRVSSAAAEGIETAQAAHLASGLPTVAATARATWVAYTRPAGVKRIVVFADADQAGAAGAQSLKARACGPPERGRDYAHHARRRLVRRVGAARHAVTVAASERPQHECHDPLNDLAPDVMAAADPEVLDAVQQQDADKTTTDADALALRPPEPATWAPVRAGGAGDAARPEG